MTKNNRNKPRPHDPSKQPLFVVCGLPPITDSRAEGILRKACEDVSGVVHLPTGVNDNSIYNSNYIDQAIKATLGFARKRRDQPNLSTTPGRICLIYVPSRDSDALVDKLDYAVFPIKLEPLADRDQKGKMWRHDIEAVTESLIQSVAEYHSAANHFNRIAMRRTGDAIFLPPGNFELKGGRLIGELFGEMRRGLRLWSDEFREADLVQYQIGDLPKLEGPSKFRRDHRKIVFAEPGPSGYHGIKWDEEGAAASSDLSMLRSLYRFGGALPSGYQHDAQREYGKRFKSERFMCSAKGPINVSDHHADIYANDFVRHRR